MAINTQKFLPQGKKGGAVSVRPKVNIVPTKSKSSGIVKVSKGEESPLFVIKTKLIKIDDILKGTLAAEKKAENDKRKSKERVERKEDENELEDDSKEGKKFKIPAPKKVLSFWEKIKSFFSKVLFGFLAVRLIEWLPKLMPILKLLAGIADFVIKVGGFLLNGLITFVDWGYKAVEGTRGFIKNIFGEKGAQAFDSIVGHLNTLFNVIGAIALGVLAVGNESKKQKKDEINKRTKKKPKVKERYNRRQKFKQQQKRIKRKKFFKKKTPKALRKTIQRGKITAKKFTRSLKKTPQNLTKNLSKNLTKTTQAVGKNVGKATKAVSKTTQAVGKNISKVSSKVSQSAGKIVTRLGMKMNKGMVQSMKGLSKMAKGVRIPIVGPLLAALTSYLADGKWDKALFIGVGTALGEMLGTAIPIPVLGTLLGGAIGYYVGDLLYTLFRGGGAGAVLNKLKEDLKKVFNVGKAIFDWSKMGFGRLIEGIPKIGVGKFKGPNPAWLINPANIVDKVKLIGKAFFSRDPMKEEKDKKDKEKKTTTKIERNKEGYLSMLSSGKKGKIEQALYEMRINSVKTGEAHSDMVGNPKYAGDVDLIMKHGMQKVEINNGRVTLQGNGNNVTSKNENKISSVEAYASYEDGAEEVIVIPSDNNNETTSSSENRSVNAVISGGSGGEDPFSGLYESS